MSRVLFGNIQDWQIGSHLKEAALKAGLDLEKMDRAINSDSALYDRIIARNETDPKAAGHWSTPLMVFDSEPFFGQDRFDAFRWRLKQRGMI